jgi:branched-chain amino acid transport system ATP-binding protein
LGRDHSFWADRHQFFSRQKADFLMLDVHDIQLSFGGVKALSGVSVHAAASKITAVIGPNGAGKTSLFNVISGFYAPQSGRVILDGDDISALQPHSRAYRGMARTFQNVALFHGMTVLDNIKLGAHTNLRSGALSAGLRLALTRREERDLEREVRRDIIGALELDHVQHHPVEDLSYGLQKRVELARALVMRPKILLLDEPVAGMNRDEKREMSRFVTGVRNTWNTTVLLIEHDMSMVMEISDHVVVLSFGKPIASGTPDQVRTNPDVIKAYLGAVDDPAASAAA